MASETRSFIIETATTLVRKVGYVGLTYGDLAKIVGIRRASIHHYFPNKEDLGVAIVQVHSEIIQRTLQTIDEAGESSRGRLLAYSRTYSESLAQGEGCLCGMLASEFNTLPQRVQGVVKVFLLMHRDWIERTLRAGCEAGVFRADIQPQREANTVLSALQGSMFVAMSLDDPVAFDHAVEGLLAGLAPGLEDARELGKYARASS